MEKLIGLLFLSRDQMHVFHLKSKSYAEHMILNEYYTDIVEDADALAEVWQGKYGKLLTISKISSTPKDTALETLRTHADWIEKNRYKECDKDDAVMQALVDTTLHTMYSTCYKLQNLK
jgi:hypothetical protein